MEVKAPVRSFVSWLTVVAVLASAATGSNLIARDIQYLKAIKNRGAVSELPLIGSLRGVTLFSAEEWKPAKPHVAIFPIDLNISNLPYWTDVVRLSAEAEPYTEFVGVCLLDAECGGKSDKRAPFTLLGQLDPFQMRSMSLAKKRNVVLLYYGTRLVSELTFTDDPATVAREIVEIVVNGSRARRSQILQ